MHGPPAFRTGAAKSAPQAAVTACTALAELSRLQVIPGVGRIVWLTALTHLPELGTLDRKRITASAGHAPFACEKRLQRSTPEDGSPETRARALMRARPEFTKEA
jgi:hypothetical protein